MDLPEVEWEGAMAQPLEPPSESAGVSRGSSSSSASRDEGLGFEPAFCLWGCAAGGGWLGEALAGYEGEVDEVLRVLDGVDGGDGEDALGLFGEGFGVFGGVGVDAGGEGFEVAAELRGLGFEPLFGALGDGVGEDPGVGL